MVKIHIVGQETTRVDRLCSLFADKREAVGLNSRRGELKHNGGARALARAIEVDPAIVSRWNSHGQRGNRGSIPPKYNAAIIAAVDRLGIDRGLLHGILDDQCCPTCGTKLAPGQFIQVPGQRQRSR